MATFSNINNTFDNINFRTKITKLEDSKMDSYVLRKQINYSIPNSFIPKDSYAISAFVPSLKQNMKSQVEELQKLQSEIAHVEEKIRDLEVSKNMKLTKIEDLRKIIERIADEDCFDCVFTTRLPNRFTPRERSSTNSSSSKKHRFVDSSRPVNVLPVSEAPNVVLEETETTEEGEGEGAKQAINFTSCYYCSSCSYCCNHSLMQHHDLLQQSLLFWQENLAAPKKIFKA